MLVNMTGVMYRALSTHVKGDQVSIGGWNCSQLDKNYTASTRVVGAQLHVFLILHPKNKSKMLTHIFRLQPSLRSVGLPDYNDLWIGLYVVMILVCLDHLRG